MKKLFSIWCLLQFAFGVSQAQDIHFSQYWESSVLRNPGLTGIYSEDFKVGVIYRTQWGSFANPYKTTMATAEGRFAINRSAADYLTVSALFYSDKAGRAALQTVGFYPCINYNKSLSDPHNSYLSMGFTAGYLQRSYDPGKLTFDNQYQGGAVVPGAGAGEELPLAKLNHFDLGAGVSYNSSAGEDNFIAYYLGLAAYHFTQPKATFAQEAEVMNLATRWNASIGTNVAINDVWSVQLHGNLGLQGSYREYMLGGSLRWARPNDENRRDFGVSAGCQMRFGDAIIPMLKVEFKGQSLGFSYDINNSSLKAATNMRGGMEITAFFCGYFSKGYDDKHVCPHF